MLNYIQVKMFLQGSLWCFCIYINQSLYYTNSLVAACHFIMTSCTHRYPIPPSLSAVPKRLKTVMVSVDVKPNKRKELNPKLRYCLGQSCTHRGVCVPHQCMNPCWCLCPCETESAYWPLVQDLSTQWQVTVGLEHLHLAPLGDLPHPHLSTQCASQQHMGCMMLMKPLQHKLRSLTRSATCFSLCASQQHMGCMVSMKPLQHKLRSLTHSATCFSLCASHILLKLRSLTHSATCFLLYVRQ